MSSFRFINGLVAVGCQGFSGMSCKIVEQPGPGGGSLTGKALPEPSFLLLT